MSGKRALVTGGCGFIGSMMCERLLEEGYEVRATDLETADRSAIEDLDVEFIPADLTTKEDIDNAVEDIDVIFHTAAIFSYSSLIDWEVFERVNVDGTKNLCQAAVDADVDSMVHWSTSGVYGPPKEDLLPINEDHPKNPESKYDLSKWLQEKEAMKFHDEYDFDVKAIRPASVYGPGNTYGAAQILLAIARGYLRIYPLHCDYKTPFVHVEDVIRAALHLDGNGEPGEAYNVVDDQNYNVKRMIKEVAGMTGNRVYGLPIDCDTYERIADLRYFLPPIERAYDILNMEPPIEADALNYLKGNYWLTNEKLRGTGFEPKYPSYREGMPETIEWYEEQGMI